MNEQYKNEQTLTLYILDIPVGCPEQGPEDVYDDCQDEIADEKRGHPIVSVQIGKNQDSRQGHNHADLISELKGN